jgi:hypothetical protein
VSSMSTDASSLLLTDANGRGGGQPQRDYLGRNSIVQADAETPAYAMQSSSPRVTTAACSHSANLPQRIVDRPSSPPVRTAAASKEARSPVLRGKTTGGGFGETVLA